MTKYVISTAEVIKKVYIADAYTEEEALDRYLDQAPDKVEFIGELVYSIETINEYEYKREWKPQPDYNEGADYHKPKKDHEGYQYDAFKDQDIYRDD